MQQVNNETTSVMRHLLEWERAKDYNTKYLSFVAPIIHTDTLKRYDYMIYRSKKEEWDIYLKAYSINEFVDTTLIKNNLQDMEQNTKAV